jgi:hypothetical protein
MDAREHARLENIRRWVHPNFERYLRPDWERYVHPGGRDAVRSEIAECKRAFETRACAPHARMRRRPSSSASSAMLSGKPRTRC